MSSNAEDVKELGSFTANSGKFGGKDLGNRSHIDQLKSAIAGKKQNVLVLYDSPGTIATYHRIDEETGL
jgi:hypothetical protein